MMMDDDDGGGGDDGDGDSDDGDDGDGDDGDGDDDDTDTYTHMLAFLDVKNCPVQTCCANVAIPPQRLAPLGVLSAVAQMSLWLAPDPFFISIKLDPCPVLGFEVLPRFFASSCR